MARRWFARDVFVATSPSARHHAAFFYLQWDVPADEKRSGAVVTGTEQKLRVLNISERVA